MSYGVLKSFFFFLDNSQYALKNKRNTLHPVINFLSMIDVCKLGLGTVSFQVLLIYSPISRLQMVVCQIICGI